MEGRNEVTEQEEKSLPQQLKYLLTHFNMNQHETLLLLPTSCHLMIRTLEPRPPSCLL